MKQFKIRASAVGQIMSDPRAKKDKLSATTMTYCQEWLKEQIYGVKKFNSNKYTEKGIQMEDKAIEYLSKLNSDFYLKNEESFENDFLTGTPDIILNDTIIDIKCSWEFQLNTIIISYKLICTLQVRRKLKLFTV